MKRIILVMACAMVACGSSQSLSQPPVVVGPEKKVECDLVCERAELAVRPAPQPDYSVKALANANAVLESLHPAMLACYKKRVAMSPNAHAFITIDIVIGPDGRVQDLETTGGALLGNGTMACIADTIRHATFDEPHNGGTLRIHVPFSLRKVAPGEDGG